MSRFNPYDIHQFDELDPLAAVLSTWQAQADHPLLGNFAAVRTSFPALAHALDRFASDYELDEAAPPETGTVSDETIRLIQKATSLRVQEAPSVPYEEEKDAEQEETLAAEFITDAKQFDVRNKSLEEIGERARVATERLRGWGRKRAYRAAAEQEAALRLKLVVFLNNRNEMTQKKIAEQIGVSVARVTQLIGEYYNRLDYEQHVNSKRRRPARGK